MDKPSKLCCGNEMYFEWGEPSTQWDQGYPTSWHCRVCASQELATPEEIRTMIQYEDELWGKQKKAVAPDSTPETTYSTEEM